MSFQLGGQTFSPKEYYRDDTAALAVLQSSRRNVVLVTGLRRIGKTWFLRRLAQIVEQGRTRHLAKDGARYERPLEAGLPARVRLFEGKNEASRADLGNLLARPEADTLVAVDELEEVVADGALVDAMLAHSGPLVVAAAPVLFEQAREMPALFAFVTDRCEHKRLRPLSDHERRALVRQAFESDATLGIAKPYQPLALRREWGGHPMVLQQICIAIREERLTTVQDLHDRAYAVLHGQVYGYGASLVEHGLTRSQREALVQVAAGATPADAEAVTELDAHGAIIRGEGGKWEIENRVLAQYVQASGTRTAPREARAAVALRVPAKPSAPVRVFTWIHLSDLHFGAGREERRLDRNMVTRAIERDLRRNNPRPVDRVFVTGDVAFSANAKSANEYDDAADWFRSVSNAAGVPLACFRLVPGNHDVDRDVANKPLGQCIHGAVRNARADLDELLADSDARAVLGGKLAAWQRFLDGFPEHPAGVDWVEEIAEAPGVRGPLRIAGLSTVWISDERDGNRENPFVPNMALGKAQLERASGEAREDELVFVLTHHPPSWLLASSAQALERALVRVPHVHLCGHVHRADVTAQQRFGGAGRSVRYVAGAAHGDATEEYGYAWGSVRWDPASSSWQMGWAPRTYVPDRDEMVADSVRYRLDDAGFAWADIECPWPAPSGG